MMLQLLKQGKRLCKINGIGNLHTRRILISFKHKFLALLSISCSCSLNHYYMKTSMFLVLLFISFNVIAQKGIFDQDGNRLYYSEDSDRQHEVTLSDGRKGMYTERILFRESGKTYFYDYTWEQIISDNKVIMTYNFNRRRWEWVEAASLTASKYGKKDDIQRIYEKVENKYTTPDQSDNPILTYKDGNYIDEFGQTVFSLKGSATSWMNIILLHNYYQENYLDTNFISRVADHRKIVSDSLANSNSLAMAMLEIGKNYETIETTFMGGNFEMFYYTEIEGAVKILDEEQIKQLKNHWLILNPNTYRRTAPFNMPDGGFYVSKKQAKKKGIQGINSKSIVLEVKIKPESIADFQTAIGE